MFTRGNFLLPHNFVSQVLDEHAYLEGQSAFWLGSFNFCYQISVPGVTWIHPKLSFHQWIHLHLYFKGIIEQPYPENIACVIHTSSLPRQSELISMYVGLTPGKWKQSLNTLLDFMKSLPVQKLVGTYLPHTQQRMVDRRRSTKAFHIHVAT